MSELGVELDVVLDEALAAQPGDQLLAVVVGAEPDQRAHRAGAGCAPASRATAP